MSMTERMDSCVYTEVLTDNPTPSAENIFSDPEHPYIFQKDNTTCHTLWMTCTRFDAHDVGCMS